MLFEQLVTQEIAFASGAIIMLMLALGRMTLGENKERLNKTKSWKDFGWVVTISLGIIAAFLPGVCPVAEQGWGTQIIWGIVAGGTAMLGHKVLKPAVLRRLEG